ncbi:hypothetical protein PHYC_00605 [Phycisphaerales bacterium]|nr:hypothetical protein PHYC_00605 [Phycisphaerales bacterium]
MKKCVMVGIAGVGALAAPAVAGTIGPMQYLSVADSPLQFLGANAQLENFEDGALNTPGVAASAGFVLGGSAWVDSVDGDDGFIDGACVGGHSWLQNVAVNGITFTFSPVFGGNLPNWAGIVWTDGHNPAYFEAFNSLGQSLGVVVHNNADEMYQGSTAEDTFVGAYDTAGISYFRIWGTMGGLEVDHLQYGYEPVPAPGALALVGAAGLLFRMRRRG